MFSVFDIFGQIKSIAANPNKRSDNILLQFLLAIYAY